MPAPKEAQVITVVGSQRLEIDGSVTPTKVVRFMVGRQGPFTLEYREKEFSSERANEDMQKEVDELKAIGANIAPA